jgi:hypothetical protein
LLQCKYINKGFRQKKILSRNRDPKGALDADRDKPAMFLLRRNLLAFFMRDIQKDIAPKKTAARGGFVK